MNNKYKYKVLYGYNNTHGKYVQGSRKVEAMTATAAMNLVERLRREQNALAHTAIRLTKGSRPLEGVFEIQG